MVEKKDDSESPLPLSPRKFARPPLRHERVTVEQLRLLLFDDVTSDGSGKRINSADGRVTALLRLLANAPGWVQYSKVEHGGKKLGKGQCGKVCGAATGFLRDEQFHVNASNRDIVFPAVVRDHKHSGATKDDPWLILFWQDIGKKTAPRIEAVIQSEIPIYTERKDSLRSETTLIDGGTNSQIGNKGLGRTGVIPGHAAGDADKILVAGFSKITVSRPQRFQSWLSWLRDNRDLLPKPDRSIEGARKTDVAIGNSVIVNSAGGVRGYDEVQLTPFAEFPRSDFDKLMLPFGQEWKRLQAVDERLSGIKGAPLRLTMPVSDHYALQIELAHVPYGLLHAFHRLLEDNPDAQQRMARPGFEFRSKAGLQIPGSLTMDVAVILGKAGAGQSLLLSHRVSRIGGYYAERWSASFEEQFCMWSGQDTIYTINDNEGQLFNFERIPPETWVTREALQRIGIQNPNIQPGGVVDRRALASVKPTDVLVLGLQSTPPGINVRPLQLEGRSALYSLGFLLRRAAAVRLDIHQLELRVGLRVLPDATGQVVGQIFISDSLENGAGYSSFFGNPGEALGLLQFVTGQNGPAFYQPLIAAAHANECRTSCPDCLRDFANLAYHNILDWRLGLDLARVALDPAAPINFQVSYWQGLDAVAAGPYFAAQPNWQPYLLAGLQAARRNNRVVIITHPLWNTDPAQMGPDLAAAYAQATAAGLHVTCKSLFEVLRRPY